MMVEQVIVNCDNVKCLTNLSIFGAGVSKVFEQIKNFWGYKYNSDWHLWEQQVVS